MSSGRYRQSGIQQGGSTVVSASKDGTVHLWDIDSVRLVAQACSIAYRNLSRSEWNKFLGPDVPYVATCARLQIRDKRIISGGQGVAVAAHAVALTSKGPAGTCCRHRSRSSSRRAAGSDVRYAPAGPTPSVNVSHHDSNPAWRTWTVNVVTWIAPSPACAKSSARWPSRTPGMPDSSSTPGSSSRAARQNALSGPRPPA